MAFELDHLEIAEVEEIVKGLKIIDEVGIAEGTRFESKDYIEMMLKGNPIRDKRERNILDNAVEAETVWVGEDDVDVIIRSEDDSLVMVFRGHERGHLIGDIIDENNELTYRS